MDKTCRHSRPLFWAMMLAVITTMIPSIWMLLNLSYRHGGINGNSWFFSGGAKAPYNYIISLLINPPDTNWLGWIFKSVGSLVMLFNVYEISIFMVSISSNRICYRANLDYGSNLGYRFFRLDD